MEIIITSNRKLILTLERRGDVDKLCQREAKKWRDIVTDNAITPYWQERKKRALYTNARPWRANQN